MATSTSTPTPLPSSTALGEFVEIEQRDDAGHLTTRTGLLNGVPQGAMISFAPDEKISAHAPYDVGALHGVLKIFDEAGKPVQEATYWHGVQQGLTRVFSAGHLLSEQYYLAGRLHGESTAYAESGDVSVKQFFRNGLAEGEALFMNEGGLVRRTQSRQGLLEGETTDYDRDGAVVQRSIYKNNLLDGPLTRYWPNGQVMEMVLYRAGKPIGKPSRFDSKGVEVQADALKTSLMQRLEKFVKG